MAMSRRLLSKGALSLAIALSLVPSFCFADNYVATLDVNASLSSTPSAPPRRAIVVTPSDTKDLTNATGDNAAIYANELYIGTTGDVAVVLAGDQSNSGAGTSVTFKTVPVGRLSVQVRRVMATGTTASNIIGLYSR